MTDHCKPDLRTVGLGPCLLVGATPLGGTAACGEVVPIDPPAEVERVGDTAVRFPAVIDARYTVRDFVLETTRFRARREALPPDGTEVTVELRLRTGG